MNLLGTVLVYGGLLSGAAGAASLIRPWRFLGVATRAQGATALGMAVVLLVIGALLPAPESRVATPGSRLDAIVPAWQFAEQHELRIHATPSRVMEEVRRVTAREIALFRLLAWIRSPRPPWQAAPASILAPPADAPILEVALRSGFVLLAEDPGREIVFGSLVVRPHRLGRPPSPEDFSRAEPGWARAVMNFRVSEDGGGWTRLTTETRVFATDGGARRRFAAYWRLIYPGSSLIRVTWLRAIRARAEAPPSS